MIFCDVYDLYDMYDLYDLYALYALYDLYDVDRHLVEVCNVPSAAINSGA